MKWPSGLNTSSAWHLSVGWGLVWPQWGHSGATMIQTVADTEEDNGWSVVEEYTAVVARIDMVLRAWTVP